MSVHQIGIVWNVKLSLSQRRTNVKQQVLTKLNASNLEYFGNIWIVIFENEILINFWIIITKYCNNFLWQTSGLPPSGGARACSPVMIIIRPPSQNYTMRFDFMYRIKFLSLYHNWRAKLEPPPRGASPLVCHKKIVTIFCYNNSKIDQYFIFRYYNSNVTKILQI